MKKSVIKDIKFDDKFCSLISLKRINEIIGTEFDNSHYYFIQLHKNNIVELNNVFYVSNKKDNTSDTSFDDLKDTGVPSFEDVESQFYNYNVCTFKSKKSDSTYTVYFNGESKFMTFFDFSFDKIDDEGFKKILNAINDRTCFEESIPFFTVKEELKGGNFVSSNKHIFFSLEEVIKFFETV